MTKRGALSPQGDGVTLQPLLCPNCPGKQPLTGNNAALFWPRCLHTPAVVQSLRSAPKCGSPTPAVGKSLRSVPKCGSPTPAVGKSLGTAPKCGSPTPAVGKSLQVTPEYSLRYLPMLLQVLIHMFGPSTALNLLKTDKNTNFSTFNGK